MKRRILSIDIQYEFMDEKSGFSNRDTLHLSSIDIDKMVQAEDMLVELNRAVRVAASLLKLAEGVNVSG